MSKILKAKNIYKIEGKTAFIYAADYSLQKKINFFTIDTEDLPKILKYKWYIDHKGYVTNKTIGFIHRLITECPKGLVVDHISHNKLNNKKENLRICTQAQNMQNRIGAQPRSSTNVRGVHFNGTAYQAGFMVDGKKVDLGSFRSIEEAKGYIRHKRAEAMPFSVMDQEVENPEFLEQQRGEKIQFPAVDHVCCNLKQSSLGNKDFKNFLHYPQENIANCGSIKFELSMFHSCVKCGSIALFNFKYDSKNRIVYKTPQKKVKKKNLPEKLELIRALFIKNVETPRSSLYEENKSSNFSKWYYGLPVSEGIFKIQSLDNKGFDGFTFTDTIEADQDLRKTA